MNKKIREAIEDNPIIAAVRDDDGLTEALTTDCQVIFILYGNICTIGSIVDRICSVGKYAFVHMDLVEGLASKDISVNFIKENTNAHGIISTKSPLIKRGKELGLFTVQRFFILDSLAIKNMKKQIEQSHPDFLEILPGLMPRVITKISQTIDKHLITGGMICEKEDILNALNAGSVAISTTKNELWYM